MKEFSTFADGYDCRDCLEYEKLVEKQAIEIQKLKTALVESTGELNWCIKTKDAYKAKYIDKLEQRENELDDYKIKVSNLNKLLQNGVLIEVEDYLNIVGVIRNIVDDIETPYRLGLSESKINPEWKALNRAKELINKWNKEGPY